MSTIKRFLTCERGTMSLEAVIAFPLLLWTLGATFLFWDVFHSMAVSQRAAYTIADTISRENTNPITAEYLDGMSDVHAYLIQSPQSTRLRVTTISWDDTNNKFQVIWSHSPDANWVPHTDATINDQATRIPQMAKGDVAIIVETQNRYTPFLNVGIGPMTLESFVVTRPRFGPQLAWENADGTLVVYGSG